MDYNETLHLWSHNGITLWPHIIRVRISPRNPPCSSCPGCEPQKRTKAPFPDNNLAYIKISTHHAISEYFRTLLRHPRSNLSGLQDRRRLQSQRPLPSRIIMAWATQPQKNLRMRSRLVRRRLRAPRSPTCNQEQWLQPLHRCNRLQPSRPTRQLLLGGNNPARPA